MADASTYRLISEVVRRIPFGRVTTYGRVAVLAGMPDQARLVGYALHALPEHTAVPWHRVINARGGISLGRAVPGGELVQRLRLESEGIRFDARGRVNFTEFGWTPDLDQWHLDAGSTGEADAGSDESRVD
jgi:methylated-DNA-protein-cysteine methyltransferase related protein